MRRNLRRAMATLLVLALLTAMLPAGAVQFPEEGLTTQQYSDGQLDELGAPKRATPAPSVIDGGVGAGGINDSAPRAAYIIENDGTPDEAPGSVVFGIVEKVDFSAFNPIIQEEVAIALRRSNGDYETLTNLADRVKSIIGAAQPLTADDTEFLCELLSISATYLTGALESGWTLQDAIATYKRLEIGGLSATAIEASLKDGSIVSLLEQMEAELPEENVQPLASSDPFEGVQANTEKFLSAPYTPMENVKEQINLVSGGLDYSVTDAVLPGVNGLDLVIGRSYDSMQANYYTAFTWLTQKSIKRDILGLYERTTTKLYHNDDGSFTSKYENTYDKYVPGYRLNYITNLLSARNQIFDTGSSFYAYGFEFLRLASQYNNLAPVDVSDIQASQETTPQTPLEYLWDMGAGWSMNFSYMLLDPQFASTGVNRVCLSDGREFALSPNSVNGLGEYFYEDVKCVPTSGTMNGKSLAYLVTYADGKKEYFSSEGFLMRTEDRFGNQINFSYVAPRDGERREMTITDTLGQVTKIYNETTGTGYNKIIELPDGKKIIYVLKENTSRKIPFIPSLKVDFHEYNLVETINQENQKTTYSYTDGDAPYDILSRLKGPLKDGTYACDPYNNSAFPNKYPNQYVLTYYRPNYYANLTQITYPTGAQSNYTYNRRWNNWLEIGQKIDYAVASRYTVQDGKRCDEKKYVYGNQYWSKTEDKLLDNIYNWDNYYHTQDKYAGSYSRITVNEEDPVRNTRTKYEFNRNGFCETVSLYYNETLVRREDMSYYRYDYFDHPSIVSKKITEYNTVSGTAQSTTEKFTYDHYGNEVEKWTALAEGDSSPTSEYKISTTYDPTYNIPLSKTYKQDAATTVVCENALTPDKKSISQQSYLDNGQLRAKTEYLHDSYGNIITAKAYSSFSPERFVQTDYTYRQGAYLEKVSIGGLKDADGAALGSMARSAIKDIYGNVISEVDGNGNTIAYQFDGVNRIRKVTYPDNTTNLYEYDTLTNRTTVTDELGNKTLYQYNQLGKLTNVYELSPTDALTLVQTLEYDAVGRKTKETTHNGAKYTATSYQYNYNDKLVDQAVRDQSNTLLAHEFYTIYADKTQKTVEGDSSSPSIVSVEYRDKYGRTARKGTVINGAEALASYTFDYVGNVLEEKSARANVENFTEAFTKKFEYDYAGQPTKMTDVYGNVVTTEYDGLGQKVAVTDARSNADGGTYSTRYQYDSAGRTISEETPITAAANGVKKYYYDGNSNITKVKQSNSAIGQPITFATTEYTYNTRNWLKSVKQGGITTAQYEHDLMGRTLSVTTGEDNATRYTLDRRGNVLTETDPLGMVERSSYDLANNLIQTIDKNGSTITYTVDGLGRQTGKSVKVGDIVQTETTEYSLTGNVKSATNASGTIANTYNGQGLLAKQTAPNGVVNDYTYNTSGSKTSSKVIVNGIEKLLTNFQYDKADRLEKVLNGATVAAIYSFDSNGNRSSLTYPNGVRTDYSYNLANQVTNLSNKRGTSVLSSFEYTYYLDGNQASKCDSDGLMVDYVYDSNGRLASERESTVGSYIVRDYEYDISSNRTKMSVGGSEQSVTSYFYDKNNRLIREEKATAQGRKLTGYQYDANGNTLTASTVDATALEQVAQSTEPTTLALDSNIEYGYDGFNRQVTSKTGTTESSYSYLPNGLRNTKTVDGKTTAFIWDGDQLVCETSISNTRPIYECTLSSYGTAYEGKSLGIQYGKTYWLEVNGVVTECIAGDEPADPMDPPMYQDKPPVYLSAGEVQVRDFQGVTINELDISGRANQVIRIYDIKPTESTSATDIAYVRGMNLISAVATEAQYYLFNAHGDVVQLTNSLGVATKTYQYDAFGNEKDQDSADLNPFRYCGEYLDKESNTYYLRARYYSAQTGRFLSEDSHWNTSNMVYGDNPLRLNEYTTVPNIAAILQSGNLYNYCTGNPILYQDTNGDWIHFAIGALAGAAVGAIVDILVQGVSNGFGNIDWGDVGISAVGGALSGVLSASGAGLLAQALGNGLISGGSYLAKTVYHRGVSGIDPQALAFNIGLGVFAGILGGKGADFNNYLSSLSNQFINRVSNAFTYKSGAALVHELANAFAYYLKSAGTTNLAMIGNIIKASVPAAVVGGEQAVTKLIQEVQRRV